MTEILYRGMRVGENAKEWVYGYAFRSSNGKWKIKVSEEDTRYVVDRKTIGQFTGLTDKNGTRIFEGDIVLVPSGLSELVEPTKIGLSNEYVIYKKKEPNRYAIYNQGFAFTLGTPVDTDYAGIINYQHNKMAYQLEVIGNIHINPEMLKGGAE